LTRNDNKPQYQQLSLSRHSEENMPLPYHLHHVEKEMKPIIVLILLLLSTFAEAKDIQLFNPDVLGQSTREEVKLLQDRNSGEIEPLAVVLNPENGWYKTSYNCACYNRY